MWRDEWDGDKWEGMGQVGTNWRERLRETWRRRAVTAERDRSRALHAWLARCPCSRVDLWALYLLADEAAALELVERLEVLLAALAMVWLLAEDALPRCAHARSPKPIGSACEASHCGGEEASSAARCSARQSAGGAAAVRS